MLFFHVVAVPLSGSMLVGGGLGGVDDFTFLEPDPLADARHVPPFPLPFVSLRATLAVISLASTRSLYLTCTKWKCSLPYSVLIRWHSIHKPQRAIHFPVSRWEHKWRV